MSESTDRVQRVGKLIADLAEDPATAGKFASWINSGPNVELTWPEVWTHVATEDLIALSKRADVGLQEVTAQVAHEVPPFVESIAPACIKAFGVPDADVPSAADPYTAQIDALTLAIRSAADGLSLAQTVEGALTEVVENLQSVHRLTVQSLNGTNSSTGLASLQAEASQCLFEINRIAAQTDFNGLQVFSQELDQVVRVGADEGETLTIHLQKVDSEALGLDSIDLTLKDHPDPGPLQLISTALDRVVSFRGEMGAAQNQLDSIIVNLDNTITNLSAARARLQAKAFEAADPGAPSAADQYTAQIDALTLASGNAANGVALTQAAEDALKQVVEHLQRMYTVTAQGVNGTNSRTILSLLQADVAQCRAEIDTISAQTDFNGIRILAEESPQVIRVGADESEILTIHLQKTDTVTLGVDTADLTRQDPAGPDLLAPITTAIDSVHNYRGALSAARDRLSGIIANLDNTIAGLSEARASESKTANLTKREILQQTATEALRTPGEGPQGILALLNTL
ncbi:flagellin [Streptomyces subrutilus]|nr:flagellin [Streptomyces subrutilus]GGZ64528.1 flagellin [Streptomyces subrutilus]